MKIKDMLNGLALAVIIYLSLVMALIMDGAPFHP